MAAVPFKIEFERLRLKTRVPDNPSVERSSEGGMELSLFHAPAGSHGRGLPSHTRIAAQRHQMVQAQHAVIALDRTDGPM